MTSDVTPLARLPQAIKEKSGGKTIPYRKLYRQALDAEIPVEWINGRGYVRDADLAVVARHNGISLAPEGADAA